MGKISITVVLSFVQKGIQNLVIHIKWSFYENSERLNTVNYFWEILHLRCLTEFWILLCISLIVLLLFITQSLSRSLKSYWSISTDFLKAKNFTNAEGVRTQSFSGPCFPSFTLNTEIYSVNVCIEIECRKIRTRKTPNTVSFRVVSTNTKSIRKRNFMWFIYFCHLPVNGNIGTK